MRGTGLGHYRDLREIFSTVFAEGPSATRGFPTLGKYFRAFPHLHACTRLHRRHPVAALSRQESRRHDAARRAYGGMGRIHEAKGGGIMGIARRILGRLNHFDVADGAGDVFFRRYDILKSRWGSVYLHEFFRSDKDRCLHDHPWHFLSVVLRGGYWEEMQDGKHWRRAGSVLRRPAATAHRIELDPARKDVWSLVFVTRKVRAWGFLTVDGWRAWESGQGDPICEEARFAPSLTSKSLDGASWD